MAKDTPVFLFALTILCLLTSITFFILFPSWSLFPAEFDRLELLNHRDKSTAVTMGCSSRMGRHTNTSEKKQIDFFCDMIDTNIVNLTLCVIVYIKRKKSLLPPGAFGSLAGSESKSVVHRLMLLGESVLSAIAGDHISALDTIKQNVPAEQ